MQLNSAAHFITSGTLSVCAQQKHSFATECFRVPFLTQVCG